MTRASICTIGDEILIGQIIDTNSSRIASELNKAGIIVHSMLSIGDDRQEISGSLLRELEANDIVITTGGLGPTRDDITKAVLAELSCSSRYVENKAQTGIIHRILSSRGLDVLDINLAQAMVPENCDVINNRLGTAPVMVVRFGKERFGHKATLYALPGVPFEAKGVLDDVMADIRKEYPLSDIIHRTIMTFGMAESALADKISGWEDSLPADMHLAYLPDPLKGVSLRLSVYGGSHDEKAREIDEKVAELKAILGDVIYADKEEKLEETIGKLLRNGGWTISAAESCTGGMISSLITSVPGASDYFLGSVTSYANSVKTGVLGVPEEIIDRYGAVSSECVAAMAEGVRKITGSDYSVATSGIAGPGGGSDDKPVGLVWVGVSSAKGTATCCFNFRNDRKRNIERFAASALDTIRKFILKDLNK